MSHSVLRWRAADQSGHVMSSYTIGIISLIQQDRIFTCCLEPGLADKLFLIQAKAISFHLPTVPYMMLVPRPAEQQCRR